MPFPVLILILVFLLIAIRRLGRHSVPIWVSMLLGALAVLVGGSIAPAAAWHAIDADVMLFLFAMFVIGDALERSGLLFSLAYRVLQGARSTGALILRLMIGAACASALLMNDTLAIVGTPLVLRLAREHRIEPRLLLLTLAFAVTIGSVTSPIGNPQNLLIALHGGLNAPFASFFRHLLVPTIISLGAAFLVLRLLFRREFHQTPLEHAAARIGDPALARLAGLALALLIGLIAVRIMLPWLQPGWELKLSHIGLVAALPLLLASPRRFEMMRHVDWRTLTFFAAMFVLMRAVWDSGFFQALLPSQDLAAPSTVLGISLLLSQLISNVPMVALYLPVLDLAGSSEAALMALAAGSTVAGNLLLLGAASNIIIVQNAEQRAGVTLSFLEFARVGIPLTVLNALIYWAFLPG